MATKKSTSSTASILIKKENALTPSGSALAAVAVIKTEKSAGGGPSMPTERLSSFRLPRDLTLGGGANLNSTRNSQRPNLVNNNKKVYAPNLNAIRNKNT